MKLYELHLKIKLQLTQISTFILVLMLVAFSSAGLAQEKSFVVSSQANPLRSYAVPSNRESHPFFVDIDGDGDLDCFSGEYTNSQLSQIYFYRNDGSNKKPEFKLVSGQGNPFDGVEANMLSIPYFVDIDKDGDYDCFVGEGTTGAVIYYKNVGSATQPVFKKQSAAFNPLSMVKFSTSNVANPAFADVDGDGDYDCLIVDEAGNLNFFRNTGTAYKPQFVHIDTDDNPFKILSARGGVYNVSFEDWNKDGLIDLFINTTYYKNIGTKRRPQFSSASDDKPVFENASAYKFTYVPLRWVDLNNDGKPEVIQGNGNGGFTYRTFLNKEKTASANNTNASVYVSPNPSKEEFVLNLPSAVPSVIRVIDVEGRLLSTHITTSNTVKFGAELKPGTYFLQVMQNNKVVYNHKIIKE